MAISVKQVAAVLLFITLAPTAWAQSYDISTVAGGGLPSLPAPALSLPIGTSPGIAQDAFGNVYFTDSTLAVVYKISRGVLTVVAGTGYPGDYSGDGGPATSASLTYPEGIAVDAAGALYIADQGASRIRKVVNGVITTFAGTGMNSDSGDGGPAINAQITQPTSVAVDAAGNVYFAESAYIRKVSDAGIISTIAGNGGYGYTGDGGPAISAELFIPQGIAVDASGNVYIADTDNNVVRKVSTNGIINTIAGNGAPGFSGDGGPAVSAQLNLPWGLSSDTSGNIFIADANNARIRKVSVSGTITTVVGIGNLGFSGDGGPATMAGIEFPEGVVADGGGGLIIGDSADFRVRQVNSAGIINTIAGNGFINFSGDNGLATLAKFADPQGVAVSASGAVLIADGFNNAIRSVSTAGVVTTVAGDEIAGYSGDNGPAISAMLSNPLKVAVDQEGNLYIAGNSVIRKVSTDGIITTYAGNGTVGYSGDGGPATAAALNYPEDVAVDGGGNVYIADTSNLVIRKVDPAGTITTIAGNGVAGYAGDGGPALSAQLAYPRGLTVDATGNVFIADTTNNRIRKITRVNGLITTVAGSGTYGYFGDNGPAVAAALSSPEGVAVDGNGTLYIADSGNNVVRKVAAGIITTISGNGSFGYAGNGPATGVPMATPTAVAVGIGGVLFIADSHNNAIRELSPCAVTLGSVFADANAQTVSNAVNAASTCQWVASNLPPWITSATSGSGIGSLGLTLQANTTGADRSASITVNGVPLPVTQAFTVAAFSDVIPGNYYFDAVNLLKSKNITSGCGGSDYCPSSAVTRDEMAILLVRTILGTDDFTYSTTPYFGDVPSTYFAFKWIQKLYELGVTAGCSANPLNYCPGTVVTRDQMAIFIIRARYGSTTAFTFNPAAFFADVPSTYFAFDWVQQLYQDSVTAGCALNPLQYCPGNPVIRGDMAIFLMRGGFNQLIPSTEPVVASISPTTLTHGTTASFTITGVNTAFVQGTTQLVFSASSGVTVNTITVTSPTTMQVSLTAAPSAPLQPVSIYEKTEPQEAVLPNGLLIQ